jgi:hypothetical protein
MAKADLYVAYQIAYTKEQQWNTYNVGGPYAWRYGGGTGMATSENVRQSTVITKPISELNVPVNVLTFERKAAEGQAGDGQALD